MEWLRELEEHIPEPAKDIRLNLRGVMSSEVLSATERWGVALASALTARCERLTRAVHRAARPELTAAELEDAFAAAALMAMNNVFYRFRHMIGRAEYAERPARLRMLRIAKPAAKKVDFELYCLAVSAINGCESCVRSHERSVLDGGLSRDHVHDAIRIAATIQAAAIAIESNEVLTGATEESAPHDPAVLVG